MVRHFLIDGARNTLIKKQERGSISIDPFLFYTTSIIPVLYFYYPTCIFAINRLKYTFTKEVIPGKSVFQRTWYNSVRIYRIFDADKLIGIFKYRHIQPAFSIGDQEYFIEVNEEIFKKSAYRLIDRSTNELIGEFKLHIWRATTFRFAKPNPQENEHFIFEKVRPQVAYSIFKKSSWGHYKFQLSNGIEAAVYSLKTGYAISSYRQHRPSTGEVELFGQDMVLLFAGLFLIERHFKNEDSGS